MSNKIRKIQKNMLAKEFVHFPDESLWQESKPVTNFGSDELYAFIRRMRLANSREKGIGVAGPQVGVHKRAFYYHVPQIGEGVMINPEILGYHGGLVPMQEGCLSIRGYYWDVHRSESVQLYWQDQHGTEHTQMLDGMMARLAQHEIDHLNGVLLVDHLSDEDYDKFSTMFFDEGKRADFGPMFVQPND